MTPPNASIMSATSSVSSLSMDSSSSGHNKATSASTYPLVMTEYVTLSLVEPFRKPFQKCQCHLMHFVLNCILIYLQPNNHSSNANHSTSREHNDTRCTTANSRDNYQPLAKVGQPNAIYNTPASLNNSTSSNSSGHYNQPLPPHQQNSPHKNPSPDFYIIRVTYETDNVELDGIVLYKSIMLGNNERTPQVIKNSMLKLGLEGDPDKYTLSQVLPDKELIMPPNANVYYAVNTAYNLNFILRPKRNTGI